MIPMGLTPASYIEFDATNVARPLVSGRGLLMGFAVEEVTGSGAARFAIRDGANVNAPLLVPVRLGPNESRADTFAPTGWLFLRGLFIDVTAGTVAGQVACILQEQMSDGVARYVFNQSDSGYFDPGEVDQ